MNTQTASTAEMRRTFYQIAWVFNLVVTILMGFAVIPLAWCIPMTAATKRAYLTAGTPQEEPHIVLGVCVLIFMGVVGGILILIASVMHGSDPTVSRPIPVQQAVEIPQE